MLEIFVLFFFPGLMVYAAISDLLTMTISNMISILLAVGFVILALWLRLPFHLFLSHFLCAALVLLATFILFSWRWVGGGDAKLAAATALWFGFEGVMAYLLLASILGAALTFLLLAVRKYPLPVFLAHQDWIARLHHPKTGIPYGIALALSALYLYADTKLWELAMFWGGPPL